MFTVRVARLPPVQRNSDHPWNLTIFCFIRGNTRSLDLQLNTNLCRWIFAAHCVWFIYKKQQLQLQKLFRLVYQSGEESAAFYVVSHRIIIVGCCFVFFTLYMFESRKNNMTCNLVCVNNTEKSQNITLTNMSILVRKAQPRGIGFV